METPPAPPQPSGAQALYQAGVAALHAGDAAAAAGFFKRALALDPRSVNALFGLGNALVSLQRYAEADARYAEALALKPNSAPLHANRGAALAKLNRAEDAIVSYDAAIALKPDFFEALLNRGSALYAVGRFDDAVASFDRAAAINPRDAMTLAQRGTALMAMRCFGAAAESYGAAFALESDYGFRLQQLHARMAACLWDGFDAEVRALEQVPAQGLRRASPYPLIAPLDSPAALRALAIGHTRERNPEDSALGPLPRRSRPERLRVGYFSPDFHNHPVSHLLVEALEFHDRNRFDIVAFSYGPNHKDDLRARLRTAIETFLDVRALGDREIAARARDMAIDIAVDLSGYTTNGRPAIFAHRAAPVQVNYLGYPATTGAPFMDYLIADKVVIPDASRDFYTEKIVTLPHCYQPGDRKRGASEVMCARETYGLPASGVVFAGFHNTFKITPVIFDAWMNILRAVNGSVLWLRFEGDEAAANLRREAAARGIDDARLVFARHVPIAEHMARHRLADIFLDTYPYNAHSTTNDSLWMGLPVVTLVGQTYAARVAASLLTAAGLPELITRDPGEYQTLAIALAGDPARVKALKDKLAAARSAPLFDTPRFTQHLEAAYEAMADRLYAGAVPDHIDVAP